MWFKSIYKSFQTPSCFSQKNAARKEDAISVKKRGRRSKEAQPNLGSPPSTYLSPTSVRQGIRHVHVQHLIDGTVEAAPPTAYKNPPCNPSLASFPSFFFFRRHGCVLLVPPYLACSPRVALRSSRRPHVLCASMSVRAFPPWTLTPSAPAAPPLSCKHRFPDCIRHIVSGRRRRQASRAAHVRLSTATSRAPARRLYLRQRAPPPGSTSTMSATPTKPLPFAAPYRRAP
jgi:hypothetical protein